MRTKLLMLAGYMALIAGPVAAAQPAIATVVVRDGICRSAPRKTAAILLHYRRGDTLCVWGEANGYYCIPYTHHNGYIAKWMVTVPTSSAHAVPRTPDYSNIPDSVLQQIANGHQPAPPPKSSMRSGYQLAPAQEYDGRVAFSDTQNHWYKVEACSGSVHFRNAGVSGDNQFSAEIAIDGSELLKPTSRPISVQFVVTLYDASNSLVARDKVTVYEVASNGGEYVLTGPLVPFESKAYSCSIKFSSAWTYGK